MQNCMAAHTPGPWEWDGKFTVGIPHARGLCYFRVEPEDARLIAAAPALLDELRIARNVISTACGERAPFAKVALARIDAAIDKATGRVSDV